MSNLCRAVALNMVALIYIDWLWFERDPVQVFQPNFPISGNPASGRTYCQQIQASQYSDELIHLIFECLYEEPRHRPTLKNLKERISQGIETARASTTVDGRGGREAWSGFKDTRAEPQPPVEPKPKPKPQWIKDHLGRLKRVSEN